MKRKIFSILFALMLVTSFSLITAVPAAAATTINVPGDYLTIQTAINAASTGDTIIVAAGTYHEQLTITKALTISGADGAVLEGTPTLLTPPLGAAAWTTGVKIKSGNVTFNNIDVTNFRQDGIIIGYESSTPGSLKNVHVTNCKISNIQPGKHGFGIYAGYQSEDFKRPFSTPKLTAHLDYSGLLIEGNEIVNTHSSAVVLQSITGTPGTLVVRGNYIHDCMNDAIWIDCGRNLVIEDNILASNLDGFYISSYADNYVANPTSAWTYETPWLPHLGGPYSPQNISITGNQITGNSAYGGVYLESGYPATIFINRNSITGNGAGVANLLTENVGATCNWWGAANGPGTVGPGSGDKVSTGVTFLPWLTTSDLNGPCIGGLTFAVNASVTGGHGSVTPASQTVNYNNPATINISPDTGYHIASITDNGSPAGIANPYVISNVTANHTVVVTFAIDTFAVNASVTGGHGSVTPATQTVDYGSSASINISPDTGYHIATITDNSISVTVANPYVISNVTAIHTVVVTFAGLKSSKQDVLNGLIALSATVTDKQDSNKLDESIKHLTKSLTPSWWVDDTHLQVKEGDKVFNEEKDAVNQLRDLIKNKKSSIPDATLQGFVDTIVKADRLLAVVAITDATGGDPKDIAKANEELGKGDSEAAKGKYDSAIEHYRNAWKQAQKS